MRIRIIYTILAFLFFLGAATFYINRVTLPRHLKSLVIESAEQYLGRKVSFDDISFNPLRGLILDGVMVYEDNGTDVSLAIDHAAVGFRYIPLIFQKKIILSSLSLGHPSAHLIHYADDQWNFSDVLDRIRLRPSRAASVPVYLSHVEINHGKIKIIDLENGAQWSEFFEETNLKADLSLSRGIGIELSIGIPRRQGWIEAKGRYHLLKRKFRGQAKLKNIPLAEYLKLSRLNLPLTVGELYINDALTNVTSDNDRIEVEGWGNVKNLDVSLTNDEKITAAALVVQKGEWTLTNGQINANGIAWVKDMKMSQATRTLAAAGAQMELNGLSLKNQSLFATGLAKLQKASFTDTSTTSSFSGDALINNLRLTHNADTWTMNGALQTQDTSLIFTPETKLTGNFKSTFLQWSQSPQTSEFKGNIDGQDVYLQWPGKELRGHIHLRNIALGRGPQGPWAGQISAVGEQVAVQLPNGHTFSTDITSALALKIQTAPVRVNIAANVHLLHSVLVMKNGVLFRGDPAGRVNVHADQTNPAVYDGTFTLEQATLENTRIDAITGITGTIGFKNDNAWSSALAFEALGMPATLKGRLQDFNRPWVDVKVDVPAFDLKQTPRFAPVFFSRNRLSLDGTAENVDLVYKGLIADAANADVRFTAQLKDATAVSAKLNQSATHLFGRIDYKKDYFGWRNLKAFYGGGNYILTGRLTDFQHPQIDTSLTSRNLKLTTRIDYAPEVIGIKKLAGVYEHTTFDVTGTSRPSGDGRPLLNLNGELNVDLNYLPALVPAWSQALRAVPLTGTLNIKGQFKGDPVHWQDWILNLTGTGNQILLNGLKIRNVKFNAVQKDNRLKPLHLWGNFYGGDFNSVASVDLAAHDLPFELILKMDHVDLQQLKNDTPLKKHDIDGTLDITALLEGSALDAKALRGKGGVQISEGKLWELDLLKGLGGILLIPEYKDIVFNEAGMNFTVKDGLMTTENLQLVSPSLTLLGRGSLDFGQNLHLVFSPDFNSDVIAGSSSLKKSSTAIIVQTEKFISVDVTGTLSKPQYKVNKSPGRILQKTGGVILENVSGFFKNIF